MIRIEDNRKQNSVKVECLKVGSVFEYRGEFYIKLDCADLIRDAFYTVFSNDPPTPSVKMRAEWLAEKTYAFSLSKNCIYRFSGREEVCAAGTATLKINDEK